MSISATMDSPIGELLLEGEAVGAGVVMAVLRGKYRYMSRRPAGAVVLTRADRLTVSR
jgi:hypothetical protein